MKQKPPLQPSFLQVLRRSSLSFLSMTPLLLGTIGLVGIFQVTVSTETLASIFHGNIMIDTLAGTLTGAVSAGHPVISYLLGGELLDRGVSLYAVTAFLLAWVTLGFIQLPAEIEVFGGRFTFYRNILTFLFTILIAIATTLTVQVLP